MPMNTKKEPEKTVSNKKHMAFKKGGSCCINGFDMEFFAYSYLCTKVPILNAWSKLVK